MLAPVHRKHMGAVDQTLTAVFDQDLLYCAYLANCEKHQYFEHHRECHAHAQNVRLLNSARIERSPIASRTRRPFAQQVEAQMALPIH